MKIAQVCPYNYLRSGGVQQHITYLTRELQQRGHEVKVIAPSFNGQKSKGDILMLGTSAEISMNKTNLEMSIAVGGITNPITELLENENFDIIHYHEPLTPVLPMQILIENKGANVGTFHAAQTESIFGKSVGTLIAPIKNVIMDALDEVIAVSTVPTTYLLKDYEKGIHIIPNGIDLARFRPDVSPIKKWRDGKINILFVGRLDKRKGVKYLLKAFRIVKKAVPNTRLLIGGKGEELEKLQKYTKKYKIQDVEFLGFIKDEDLPHLYTSCDVFCAPALFGESFGIVLLEAMASGKPVVAYANPGYKTVLKGKGSLLLAEPEDIDQLAEKLILAVSDSEIRKMMINWGLNEVKQYAWPKVTDQILDVYTYAIEGNGEKKKLEARHSIREFIGKWIKRINTFDT